MRAVVLTSFGSEEALSIRQEVEIPKCGLRQLLIRVKACALSEIDLVARKGGYADLTTKFSSAVLGYEFSGVVEQIGTQIPPNHFAVGDEVVGISPLDLGGALAEYLSIGYEFVTHKPKSITHEDGAASLLAGLRAYSAFFYHCRLQHNESVLIHNGASGANHIAVQLALSCIGARVFSTSASTEESNFLQDLPITIARVIDTNVDPQWFSVLQSETGGMGVDCILDAPSSATSSSSSSSSFTDNTSSSLSNLLSAVVVRSNAIATNSQIISCLAAHSTWITSVPLQLDPPESKLLLLRNSRLSFLFEHAWLLSGQHLGRYQHILKDLMEKVTKNILRPKVTKVFPMEKIKEAHRLLEVNRVGKIVIRI